MDIKPQVCGKLGALRRGATRSDLERPVDDKGLPPLGGSAAGGGGGPAAHPEAPRVILRRGEGTKSDDLTRRISRGAVDSAARCFG